MKYFQLTAIFILFFSFQSLSNNYKKCGTEDPRYSDCYGSVDYKNSKSIKKHTGFFKNGKPHGQGVMILKDGREIYSNFKNGTINGKTQIFSKGSTFEIQFLDGKAVSKGKFAFKGRPKNQTSQTSNECEQYNAGAIYGGKSKIYSSNLGVKLSPPEGSKVRVDIEPGMSNSYYCCQTSYTDQLGGLHGQDVSSYSYSFSGESRQSKKRSNFCFARYGRYQKVISDTCRKIACENVKQDFLKHEAPIIEANASENKKIRDQEKKYEQYKSSDEFKLKEEYEFYFIVRKCNETNSLYISARELKQAKKNIRATDNFYKSKGVDTDAAYKSAETNPQKHIRQIMSAVELSAISGYNQSTSQTCKLYFSGMQKPKKVKGKKDF